MKFFFYTLGIIGLIAVGWNYAPAGVREKTATLLSAVISRSTGEMKSTVVDLVRPESPVEERAEIIEKLKENIFAIKQKTPSKTAPSVSLKTEMGEASAATLGQLIGSSGNLIEQLEASNENLSLAEKIENRIIEMALPVKNNCPASEK